MAMQRKWHPCIVAWNCKNTFNLKVLIGLFE